jgi:hypothetical protein
MITASLLLNLTHATQECLRLSRHARPPVDHSAENIEAECLDPLERHVTSSRYSSDAGPDAGCEP